MFLIISKDKHNIFRFCPFGAYTNNKSEGFPTCEKATYTDVYMNFQNLIRTFVAAIVAVVI